MDAPKPCKLRFGLRKMFVVFTFCTLFTWWLAASASFVRNRQAALTSPLSNFSYRAADSQSAIPLIRRAMGDKAIASVLLGTWASDEEMKRAKELFPEAKVKRNDPFWERFLEWGPRGL